MQTRNQANTQATSIFTPSPTSFMHLELEIRTKQAK